MALQCISSSPVEISSLSARKSVDYRDQTDERYTIRAEPIDLRSALCVHQTDERASELDLPRQAFPAPGTVRPVLDDGDARHSDRAARSGTSYCSVVEDANGD